MKLRTLVLLPALLLFAAPPAAAVSLFPVTYCETLTVGSLAAGAYCAQAWADPTTIQPSLGPNACSFSTPIPTGTAVTQDTACCFSTGGGTFLCVRSTGVVVA